MSESSEAQHNPEFISQATEAINEAFSETELEDLTSALAKFVYNPNPEVVHTSWENGGITLGLTDALTAGERAVIKKADQWYLEEEGLSSTDIFHADGRFDPEDIMVLNERVNISTDDEDTAATLREAEETQEAVEEALAE